MSVRGLPARRLRCFTSPFNRATNVHLKILFIAEIYATADNLICAPSISHMPLLLRNRVCRTHLRSLPQIDAYRPEHRFTANPKIRRRPGE
jgi:hypothetical protein